MSKNTSENSEEKKIRELLSSNKPALLEVRAECCGNFNLIESFIQKIESEFNNDIRIARIDYETYKDLLPGLKLESFPTILLLKDGTVFKRINGTISRINLNSLVDELLNNHPTSTEEDRIALKLS